MINQSNIPDLKPVLHSIKNLKKDALSFVKDANDAAMQAMLFTMFHNEGTTRDVTALNTLHDTLMVFGNVNMASRLKAWVEASSPWRWKVATKSKPATFKLYKVTKEGREVPFTLNEGIFEIGFTSWKKEKVEAKDKPKIDLAKALTMLGNLKAKCSEAGVDFKTVVSTLEASQAKAAGSTLIKSVDNLLKGTGGKGRKVPTTQQDEQQTETTEVVQPVEPVAEVVAA